MSRRKYKKSSSKKTVFDPLIDIAGAFAIGYFMDKQREKKKGNRKKIDPYAATGAAMGMGCIKDTDDLLRFGAVMGAMGAFDPDDNAGPISSSYSAPVNNRYAWRLNCEDGSGYGIFPDDYETRDEYNAALKEAKAGQEEYTPKEEDLADTYPEDDLSDMESEESESAVLYRVSLLHNGKTEVFYSYDRSLKPGDIVVVQYGQDTATGVIVLAEGNAKDIEACSGEIIRCEAN